MATPLKGGSSLYVLSCYRANDGLPRRFAAPPQEGDDLTPALSWRRGRRTDARDGTYRTDMTNMTNKNQ